jgi:hypothetical protein
MGTCNTWVSHDFFVCGTEGLTQSLVHDSKHLTTQLHPQANHDIFSQGDNGALLNTRRKTTRVKNDVTCYADECILGKYLHLLLSIIIKCQTLIKILLFNSSIRDKEDTGSIFSSS